MAMVLSVNNRDIRVSPIFFDAIVNVVPLTSSGQAHCLHISVVNVMVDMVVFMLNNWLVNSSGTNHCTPAGVVEWALGIDGSDCRHAHYETLKLRKRLAVNGGNQMRF